MDRRALLRDGSSLLAVALAGCLGAAPGNPDDDPSPEPSPEPSPTGTPSPSPQSRVVDRSFAVSDASCGRQRDAATATVDGSRVVVTGTIDGRNTCYTARLADVAYEGRGGTLRIDVEAYAPESTATVACGQCIVEIDYEATVEFEGGPPGTVVVTHDGEEVASMPLPE